jgi:hypothetical protein
MTSTSSYSLRPIGFVRSQLTAIEDAPKQGLGGGTRSMGGDRSGLRSARWYRRWTGGDSIDVARSRASGRLAGSPPRRSRDP